MASHVSHQLSFYICGDLYHTQYSLNHTYHIHTLKAMFLHFNAWKSYKKMATEWRFRKCAVQEETCLSILFQNAPLLMFVLNFLARIFHPVARRQIVHNWLCSLEGKDGLPLSPVNHSCTSTSWVSVNRIMLAFYDTVCAAVWKDVKLGGTCAIHHTSARFEAVMWYRRHSQACGMWQWLKRRKLDFKFIVIK